jgi:hypothetical protein
MNENNIQSIKYILAFPKHKDKWRYYLNNNFENSYYLKTEPLKKFILTLVQEKISHNLDICFAKFQPFFIDVENNKLHEVTINLEKAKEKYAKEFWKKEQNVSRVMKKKKQMEKDKTKNFYEVPYADKNEKIIDQILSKNNSL